MASRAITTCVSTLLAIGLVSAANADSANGASDVVAVGPVEIVEASNVTVLGRSYRVEDTSALETGQKVTVHGTLLPDGSVTNAWAEPMGTYVAGADRVFETGVVTSVNESFGRLSIGDSEIDYTAALSEPGVAVPEKGDLVAVTGTQPELGGVVLGTSTRAGAAAAVMNVPGSGMAGVAGIVGSNRATAGIVGSNRATAGIVGSNQSTAGIVGSNRATAGIVGSNRATAGIVGSNQLTAGIVGSNQATAGIVGSNQLTAGIVGSNQATAGIVGSNQSSAGIVGSNQATAGIVGSNQLTAGIVGSNQATAGIVGSNQSSAGIVGSNRATAGIVGSNQASAGIVGSNRATAGIVGSNRATAGIVGSNRATE